VRIAVVVHGYPPSEAAGVELVAREQAEALAARGHEVAVFARALDPARADGEWWDEVVGGILVRRVVNAWEPGGSLRERYDDRRFDETFRGFLRERRAEVVHAQHLILLSPSLLRVAHEEGCAVVLSLHDAFYLCHRIFLLDRDGRRCPGPDAGARCDPCLAGLAAPGEGRIRFDDMARTLARADALGAPSPSLARRYERELPFLGGRIAIVDPGLVRVPGRPLDGGCSSRGPDRRVRFLFIGTWLPHKGLDLLVDALATLPAGSFELVVRGAGVEGHEAYVEALRERTRGQPVVWRGAFAPGELPAVLAEGDVLVLPSRCDESYSRVVREARAAGLAVVAPDSGGPADALTHERDALLVAPDSGSSLAAALGRLVADRDLLARLAAAPAAWPTVAEGAERLEEVFHGAQAHRASATAESRPRVSVVYVTKNGAPWLDESLRAVRGQRGDFDLVEVLAVDSGSTDGTLDILARHDVRVLRIGPHEFGHGRTRNVAARAARGDVVVYLTQDAAPANDAWLAPLIAELEADPLLAGVWSRHEPRPGCHPMEWRTLAEFPLFQDGRPRVSSARGNSDYAAHPELYYWFSNNSSAIRREVLLRLPFPEVEFAEDQAWARLVLEAGFRTALVPESRILHSHAYSAWTNLQRNFDHARAMAQDLGQRDPFTIVDVLRAAVRETRRDVAFWARLRGRSRGRVATRWAAPALAYHLGAFGGRWLGGRAAAWPKVLAGRLSLHERLRAG